MVLTDNFRGDSSTNRMLNKKKGGLYQIIFFFSYLKFDLYNFLAIDRNFWTKN